jgi:hypothetical protein
MFAESAKVDYHLLIANQEKQTFVFHFPFAEAKRNLLFS